MAVSTRLIRHRIKSVGNTKKITKAMELVSASKMRRAVNSVLSSRAYATLAWETLMALSKLTDSSLHPLLARREQVKKILVILIASDRGLCGGFNAQVLREAVKKIKFLESVEGQKPQIEFVTLGKKGQDAAKRFGWKVVATFNGLTAVPSAEALRPVATMAIDDFKKTVYDKVFIAYTDFISSLKQAPRFREILPFTKIDDLAEKIKVNKGQAPLQDISEEEITEKHFALDENLLYSYQYVFEPSPAIVLEAILPRLVEVQIYQALLESSASEHSARMMAMKNATEAANDMIDDLTFTFNQARQAVITREIAEISAGKAALE